MHRVLQIFFTILIMIVSMQSRAHDPMQSTRIVHDTKLTELTLRFALARYSLEGVAGLVADSKDCYSSEMDKTICIYLDQAAMAIDHFGRSRSNFPEVPYFTPDEVVPRALRIIKSPKSTPKEIGNWLGSIYDAALKEVIYQAPVCGSKK